MLNGQTEEQRDDLFVCLSNLFEWVSVKVYTDVWKLRRGTSLAGELMKTSVLEPRTISTSVMLAVVTGSQTLRVSPPPFPSLPFLGCCYILEWCSWAGYVALWLDVGLRISRETLRVYVKHTSYRWELKVLFLKLILHNGLQPNSEEGEIEMY